MPPEHCMPPEQTCPQLPQLLLLFCRSTHDPEHRVLPAGHELTQMPEAQNWPDPQALPHVPQFVESVLVLVQTPPQNCCADGQVQAPATHVDPPPQTVPHAPQFELSVCRLTHDPPQLEVPVGHVVTHMPELHD